MVGPHPQERVFLERALLREVASTWEELAARHFPNALHAPVFAFDDGAVRLGCWNRLHRTISLSRRLVFEQPWSAVREVLKHEMAHQYVDEALRIHDETAHGPAFTRVCHQHAFDAAAAGLPVGGDGQADQRPPILRRIMRLLALGDSPNLHEAEAAMNEARRLMLVHNIDASATASSGGYHVRQVGPVKARRDTSARILAGILSRHFFVSAIWVPSYVPLEARRGSTLELCGTSANLDVAEYVHGFLTETAERLWRDHKHARAIRSDRDRRSFLAGVMAGFQEKLGAGERENQPRGLVQGLVRQADAEREAHLRRRYPQTRRTTVRAMLHPHAYQSGREAGRRVDLHRPVTTGGAKVRQLPPLGQRLLSAVRK